MNKTKIPKGWRRLRAGETLKDGDHWFYLGTRNCEPIGKLLWGQRAVGDLPAIRRIARPKRTKKGKR